MNTYYSTNPVFPNLSFNSHRHCFLSTFFISKPYKHILVNAPVVSEAFLQFASQLFLLTFLFRNHMSIWFHEPCISESFIQFTPPLLFNQPFSIRNHTDTYYSMNPLFPNLSCNAHRHCFFINLFISKPYGHKLLHEPFVSECFLQPTSPLLCYKPFHFETIWTHISPWTLCFRIFPSTRIAIAVFQHFFISKPYEHILVHEPFIPESFMQLTWPLLFINFSFRNHMNTFSMDLLFPNLSFNSHRHSCVWTFSFRNHMNTYYSMNPLFPNISSNSHRNYCFIKFFISQPYEHIFHGPVIAESVLQFTPPLLVFINLFSSQPYENIFSMSPLFPNSFVSHRYYFVYHHFHFATIWKQISPWTIYFRIFFPFTSPLRFHQPFHFKTIWKRMLTWLLDFWILLPFTSPLCFIHLSISKP